MSQMHNAFDETFQTSQMCRSSATRTTMNATVNTDEVSSVEQIAADYVSQNAENTTMSTSQTVSPEALADSMHQPVDTTEEAVTQEEEGIDVDWNAMARGHVNDIAEMFELVNKLSETSEHANGNVYTHFTVTIADAKRRFPYRIFQSGEKKGQRAIMTKLYRLRAKNLFVYTTLRTRFENAIYAVEMSDYENLSVAYHAANSFGYDEDDRSEERLSVNKIEEGAQHARRQTPKGVDMIVEENDEDDNEADEEDVTEIDEDEIAAE